MQVLKHSSQSYVLLLLYLISTFTKWYQKVIPWYCTITLCIRHGILRLNVILNYSWYSISWYYHHGSAKKHGIIAVLRFEEEILKFLNALFYDQIDEGCLLFL